MQNGYAQNSTANPEVEVEATKVHRLCLVQTVRGIAAQCNVKPKAQAAIEA